MLASMCVSQIVHDENECGNKDGSWNVHPGTNGSHKMRN